MSGVSPGASSQGASKQGHWRSAIAYPVPYLGLLALVPLVHRFPVADWLALPAHVRALGLFALATGAVIAFLVISDRCYRLLDPAGLGRRTHSRSDLCEVATSIGMIAMGIAWMLHVRELPWTSVLALPVLATLWVIALGTARRAAIEARRHDDPKPRPDPVADMAAPIVSRAAA